MAIFLNNNKGNVILEPGMVYEVHWSGRHAYKTILRFVDRYFNGYCFTIIDKVHLNYYQTSHDIQTDQITYDRDQLRCATFKTSVALNILYGQIKKDPQP